MATAISTVTQKIIYEIKNNVTKWIRPWVLISNLPKNYNGEVYQNPLNNILLSMSQRDNEYKNPTWLTFNRAKKEGGMIKLDQESTCIYGTFMKYKVGDKFYDLKRIPQNKEGKGKRIPCFSPNWLYNVEQFDWESLPQKYNIKTFQNKEVETSKVTETIESHLSHYFKKHKVIVKHEGTRACYYKGTDTIFMPEKKAFYTPEKYASTLAHEAIHSTGHKMRLDRLGNQNEDESYSKEEFVAELGSNFMLHQLNIPYDKEGWDQTVSYIKGWISKLEQDEKLFIETDKKARKAIGLINSAIPKKKSKEELKVILKEVGRKTWE